MHHWGIWPSQSLQLELNYFIPQHLENIIIESRYQIKLLLNQDTKSKLLLNQDTRSKLLLNQDTRLSLIITMHYIGK